MAYYATNTHLAAMTLLKACVPCQWARMLTPQRDVFFWSCHALAAANAVFHASAILALNTGCSWSRGGDSGGDDAPNEGEWGERWRCAVDIRAFALAFSVISFAFDLIALLLPQTLIVRTPCPLTLCATPHFRGYPPPWE